MMKKEKIIDIVITTTKSELEKIKQEICRECITHCCDCYVNEYLDAILNYEEEED